MKNETWKRNVQATKI